MDAEKLKKLLSEREHIIKHQPSLYDAWLRNLAEQDQRLLLNEVSRQQNAQRDAEQQARQQAWELAQRGDEMNSAELLAAAERCAANNTLDYFIARLQPVDRARLDEAFAQRNRNASLARAEQLRQQQEAERQRIDDEARTAFEAKLKDDAWLSWGGTRESFEAAWPSLRDRLLGDAVLSAQRQLQSESDKLRSEILSMF